MNKDRPLANIFVSDVGLFQAKRIEQEGRYFPIEMVKEVSGETLKRFCENRLTPSTRIGIMDDLRNAGYEEYSFAAILICSNGRDCSDPYWVKFKDGPQTWKAVWEAIGITK